MNNDKRYLIEVENVWFDYKFTEDELKNIAQNMATAKEKLEALENEKAAFNKNIKEKMDFELGNLGINAKYYRDKKDWRDGKCYKVADYEHEDIIYIDCNTGEERKKRKMTAEERQFPLVPRLFTSLENAAQQFDIHLNNPEYANQ